MNPQVLIVGAGPTGLVMALALQKQGIPFRIVDKNSGTGEASRAIVVHARTLEYYQQLGLAEELAQRGIPIQELQIRKDGELKASMKMGDIGLGISPYPYVLSLPQDEHEAILESALKERGDRVEWNTELISFREEGDVVHAVLEKQGECEEAIFQYICGCDGAHSAVRKGLELSFAGGTYEQMFYVADVKSAVPIQGLHISFNHDGFCLTAPVRTTGYVRLIGIIPKAVLEQGLPDDFNVIAPYASSNTEAEIQEVNWFSTFKVHHRVSEHFRKGRIFIAGDAGHVHSPAGGQGMNTGIGDAMNLAWKLAAVLQGEADEQILDSYETERIGFAKTLVATTDRAFQIMVGKGINSKLAMEVIVPYFVPVLFHLPPARRKAFEILSQTRIHYPDSLLSEGKAGHLQAGDRLPWVEMSEDNYKPLQSMKWQLHVYGQADPELVLSADDRSIPLYEFNDPSTFKKAGIPLGSLFLVRPDGYIGFAQAVQNVEQLVTYLNKIKINISS